MADAISYTKDKIDQLLAEHTHVATAITGLANMVKELLTQTGATSTARGTIRLAGDLGGVPDAPTVKQATETSRGTVTFASVEKVKTGVDTTSVVTPAGLAERLKKTVESDTVTKIWVGSQAQYDALTKDQSTMYLIK